jgi:quercetin dioxygenase-like cupin family protein
VGKVLEFDEVPQSKVVGKGTTYRLINANIGATQMGVVMIELEPKAKWPTPLHYHKNRDSAYIVLQGSANLMLNGIEYQLKPRTVVFIKPGDKHGIKNTGETGYKMIEVYSPLESDFIEIPE